MTKPTLYIASNNRHKAEELEALLGNRFAVHLARDLDPKIDWDETGTTFAANAKIKADTVRAYTKAAVLADDSGLEVFALGGDPGVHSSRYAGPGATDDTNNAKLQKAIATLSDAQLDARFVCTLHFVAADGTEQTFEGELRGRLLRTPRGAHGFGYDPLFEVAGTGKSLAELDAAEKNSLSHRQNAIAALIAWLDRRR